MKFSYFAKSLSELEQISSRNDLSAHFAKTLTQAQNSLEVERIIYLILGRVAPKFEPVEFGFAEKQILKVLAKYYSHILEEYASSGDIGSSLLKLQKQNLQQNILLADQVEDSVSAIFERLYKIATVSGKDSVAKKAELLESLILALDSESLKWVIRIILGNLRIGFSAKSLTDSISIFLTGDKQLSEILEHAVGVRANIAEIGKLAYELKERKSTILELTEYFEDLKIELFVPVAAKLVERVKNAEEIIERMGNCYIQPKFDGLRIQAHVSKSRVELYSRNMENTTSAYPDLVSSLLDFVRKNKIENAILDGEVIGYDSENEKYMSFQETVQRKRKTDIGEFSSQIPVVYNVFDIIYVNNEDLTKVKIEDRIKIIQKDFNFEGRIKLTQTILVDELDKIQMLFDNYVLNNGLEGIIAKQLSTCYLPGTRNFDWVKLKRSTDSKLNDFADLVVLGYYLGKGKRTDFGIGGILCGTYDKILDKFLTVCKVGTGFSDEQFRNYKSDLDKLELKDEKLKEKFEIDLSLLEDFTFVEPKIVVEIEADEISQSKLHSAGFSLRFPRIKQWNRDKDFDQTTTKEELKRMFEMRKR